MQVFNDKIGAEDINNINQIGLEWINKSGLEWEYRRRLEKSSLEIINNIGVVCIDNIVEDISEKINQSG